MTRVLSELLGAREPAFRAGIKQLERASGCPSEDIRLSSDVERNAKESLRDLGLDPHDTSGPELYGALQEKLAHDDNVVRELLGKDTKTQNLMLQQQRLLKSLDMPKLSFALKASAAKRLLKKAPPKKAMKQLGYRSVDSMLKHEPVAQIAAAALMAETAQWHKSFINLYKQLKPADFEAREVQILAPDAKRWEKISEAYIQKYRNNILTLKEFGAVVMLPLAKDVVPGVALMTLLLAIHAINDIRTTSAYLKLHQVRPDFGDVVARTARSEPYTNASLVGDERLPWKLVQRYFSRSPEAFVPELFEPHVQQEDLKTESAEDILAELHPRFEFWKGKSHVGLLHNGRPVSLNLTDAALNFCNRLPYERRIVQYFRNHLWHELMLRYMHQDNLEQTLHEQLDDELVDEKALA
jgi:hypothetical protein